MSIPLALKDYLYSLKNNNSGLFTKSTAILLLKDIVNFVLSSSFTFSYNKAALSGGITFMKTRMILLSHIKADFNNNEGGNGAAMAFYQESVIIILPFSSNYVNVSYHNNNALKLGGAIFVEDSDYMDIFTKNLAHFS